MRRAANDNLYGWMTKQQTSSWVHMNEQQSSAEVCMNRPEQGWFFLRTYSSECSCFGYVLGRNLPRVPLVL